MEQGQHEQKARGWERAELYLRMGTGISLEI